MDFYRAAGQGNKRNAEAGLTRIINEYEERAAIEANRTQAYVPFADYMQSWLKMIKPTIATATHQSYTNMVSSRIDRHFTGPNVSLGQVSPQDIQNFYQLILDGGCSTSTVIHYHAVLRRALQNAVKKEIIVRNPTDKIDRPKKNTYRAAFYSAEEMLTLFEVMQGDPLELCVKIAAYYGLRRSEVLELRWDAINFKEKSVSVCHKVIRWSRTANSSPWWSSCSLQRKKSRGNTGGCSKKSYCGDYLD